MWVCGGNSSSVRPARSLQASLGLAALLLLMLPPRTAHAHAPSDTFLSFTLTATNCTGQWEIALRDLQHALGLEKVDEAAIRPEELRLRTEAVALDTLSGLDVSVDGKKLSFRVLDEQTLTRPNGDSLVLTFASEAQLSRASLFKLDGQILFALDPQIRSIVRLEYWGQGQQTILSAAHPVMEIALSGPPGKWKQLLIFVREGVWHIWTGYDHILFLLALLLPALLTWREAKWHGAVAFRPVVVNVLKIVTAFTVAHSLTLALAALHIVTLPSRWVESVIAASVAIAAANNLIPLFRERGWIVAFGFGLIHGFGFANVLDEAGLAKGALVMALIGFNLGVELGQLVIVSIFVPLAYQFRNTAAYRNFALKGGSVVVIMIAGIWMTERVMNFKLLPF
jgi:hypothetical protein